jgi:hypothetical protein
MDRERVLLTVWFYAPIRRLIWLTRIGSESATERRQAYLRKYAVSESSEILGSEGSRKIDFRFFIDSLIKTRSCHGGIHTVDANKA